MEQDNSLNHFIILYSRKNDKYHIMGGPFDRETACQHLKYAQQAFNSVAPSGPREDEYIAIGIKRNGRYIQTRIQ